MAAGCTPPSEVEITLERSAQNLRMNLPLHPTAAQRFGGMGMGSPADLTPPPNPFRWEVPEGWVELPETDVRRINMQPAGDPQAEFSLSILGGDGGGLTSNINRWRGQIGLDSITEAEVASLPKASLLGQSSTIVDLRGSYSGMGSEAQEDWGMLGLILTHEQFSIFVKMTGPADLIDEERPNFEMVCATLRAVYDDPQEEHSADDGHDHSADDGHDHSTHADESTSQEPALTAYAYTLPDRWRTAPPKAMKIRQIDLLVGEDSECYLIELPGVAGGLEGNINRWRGEVSMDSIGLAEIEELEKVELLGQMVPLLEVHGDYQGMGGPQGGEMTLLGVPLIRDGMSVFIKMVGPNQEVAAERAHFIQFVQSLSERP
ncbi:MAG: hypothetical protein ACI8X5_001191 [Planctomycetota bacterium]|jgi:hypothetical protein